MEINPSLRPGALRTDASPAEVRNWRVGQVLNAVATSADRGGRADLRIGAQTYQAQVPFTVKPGDRMSLEVIRTGTIPLLRPLGAERSPDPVQAALRTALPRQAPLPPLLANLAQLADHRQAPALPAPVVAAARALFQGLATPRQAGDSEGLRRALQNAGTQLEAKLAQTATGKPPGGSIAEDLKAGLLRLREVAAQAVRLPTAAPGGTTTPAQTPGHTPVPGPAQTPLRGPEVRTMPLSTPSGAGNPPQVTVTTATQRAPIASAEGRPVPPLLPPLSGNQPHAQSRAAPLPLLLDPGKLLQGLLQQVESSLARLQLHQLASQPTEGEQRQVWLLELPVRRDQNVDVLHLRIERENGDQDGEAGPNKTGWTVKLAFDLDGLGPVQARVGLHHGLVSTAFWSERRDTHSLFQQHLSELRRQLVEAGLDVGAMSCQVGQPAQPPGPQPPRSGIVDEQA